MKTNGTRLLLIVVIFQLLLLIFSFSLKAQPDYYFNTPSLVSGVDRQVGAVYKYTNVKPGVDATVTITAISPGISVADIDGGSGYLEALQPTLDVSPNTKGYLEMLIQFYRAGTNVPMVQPEVPATCIDVDGTSTLNEFDEINMGPGAYVDYDMLGTELTVSPNGVWWVGTNKGGVDYPGRDTAAKSVMFTTVNASILSLIVRVGADNRGGSTQQRLRSVYWKKFTYANSFLAKPALLSFRGNRKSAGVELQWDLISEHNIQKVIIEKSTANSAYSEIGEVWVNTQNNPGLSFRYTDKNDQGGTIFYRIRMISMNGSEQLSNILAFRNTAEKISPFRVYPSLVQSRANISLNASQGGVARLMVADLSGRVVYQQFIEINEGENNIALNSLDKLVEGSYVAILDHQNNRYTQKIVKQ